MTNRILALMALPASMALGVGAVLLWSVVSGPNDTGNKAGSITGVASGAAGSDAPEDEQKGVDSVQVDTQTAEIVDIQGVEGTDGTSVEQENTIEGVNSVEGSVQPIRGIEGIDTIAIQNLETVLQMQAPEMKQDGQGGVATAAALMTMEDGELDASGEEPDGREELEELELEGS